MTSDSALRLTSRQIKALKSMRWKAKKAGDCRLLLRIQGVFMLDKGFSAPMISTIIGVHVNSIYGWEKAVRTKGVNALPDKPLLGPKPRLNPDQQAELKKIIECGPEANGLETGVWTSPLVKEVIRKTFNEVYDVSQVRRILERLGFSVQYPRIQLSKADKEKQRTWLNTELPEVKKKSERKKEF